MKSIKCSLMLFTLFLAATMPVPSQIVRTDWDHHADFTQYKSYSWGKVVTFNSLWDDRVKSAIDQQLTKKGWTQVPEGGDATVMAFRSGVRTSSRSRSSTPRHRCHCSEGPSSTVESRFGMPARTPPWLNTGAVALALKSNSR